MGDSVFIGTGGGGPRSPITGGGGRGTKTGGFIPDPGPGIITGGHGFYPTINGECSLICTT